ncbi:hypothetical protein J8J22_20675, partial [Mycobacterium tuberculosis]|nr:hypothetical protein [Mycobacterium tuberculosis]
MIALTFARLHATLQGGLGRSGPGYGWPGRATPPPREHGGHTAPQWSISSGADAMAGWPSRARGPA